VLALRRFQTAAGTRSPLAKTTAGSNGKFALRVSTRLASDRRNDGRTCIAATADGFGTQWHWQARAEAANELVLQLSPEALLHGQVVDLEGKPVADAQVKLLWQNVPNEDFAVWLHRFATLDASSIGQSLLKIQRGDEMPGCDDDAQPPTTTDQNGRFILAGIGADHVARLELCGETIAYTEVNVATRAMQPIQPKGGVGATDRMFGTDFIYHALPTRPIVGTVSDAASGAPLAGVTVESRSLAGIPRARGVVRATTDAQGKYRLIGVPRGNGADPDDANAIAVVLQDDRPYFPSNRVKVPETPGLGPVTLDFKLTRGLWITGRVTDQATGKPVESQLFYSPFLSNPIVKRLPEFNPQVLVDAALDARSMSRADGTYRLIGLPGRGLVSARAIGRSYRIGVGASEIEGMSQNSSPPIYFPGLAARSNALKEINPKPGTESVTCDLIVDAGATVRISLVDPAGKPVGPGQVWVSRDGRATNYNLHDSVFMLSGVGPHELKALLITQAQRHLGKVFVYRNDAKVPRPLTVTLEPCATVKGRLVDEEGVPFRNLNLSANAHGGDEHWLITLMVTCDSEGRFQFTNLAPGCDYYRIAAFGFTQRRRVEAVAERLALSGGQTVDLGEIKLKRQK
jgi:protocatechuate 3,4-dioxygenase beta subunit